MSLISSAALLLLAFSRTVAFASWAPLQDVVTSVQTSGSTTTVKFKVQDPDTAQWFEGSESYTESWNTVWFVANLAAQDGVVVWTAEERNKTDWHIMGQRVCYAVFDPTRGVWMKDSVPYTNTFDRAWDIGSLSNESGVVVWKADSSNPVTSQDIEHRVVFATYDPEAGRWQQDSVNYSRAGYNTWFISSPLNWDGVLTWTADRYDDFAHRYLSYNVAYAVYDPSRGQWMKGNTVCASTASLLDIVNSSVECFVGATSYRKGYKAAEGGWKDGYTQPLAYFYASPSVGNPPMRVWFTDMSIGGGSWQYDFGDGGKSSIRSPWHTYNSAGAYTATQTVTGFDGTDSISRTIKTDLQPPTGTIIINAGAGYTKSASVTLTLSAADNSGTVSSMRFSNDGSNWSGWEAYKTSKTWTLSSGDGTKTVYAQFKDPAENVSGYCSDSIILDATAPTVTSTTPINGAIDVPVSTAVTAVFDGNMDPTTITAETFTLKDSGGNSVSGAVGYAGVTATFTPAAKLAYETIYTATITTGVKDIAGNSPASDFTWSFTTIARDTTPPAIAITSPTSDPAYSTNNVTLSIGGSASDNVGVTGVTWSNDRGGSGTCAGTTTWSAAGIRLALGVNVITITASDAAENTATDTLTVTFTDTTPPSVQITSPTSSPTYVTSAPTLDIAGTASDDVGIASVTWSNDRGGSGACTGTTAWSAAGIALALGVNVITVTASDTSAHAATDTLTVTYDPTPPTVTITIPTSDPTYATTNSTLSIAGTASDDVGVMSVTWSNDRGGNGTCAGTTSWSATEIRLYLGVNVITATASDAAENTGTDTLTVTFTDTTPPIVAITNPTSDPTYSTGSPTINLGGLASDDAGVTSVTWSNNHGGSGTCVGTTSWSATGVSLGVGENVITVTARDASGNSVTDTLTVTYEDKTPPTITITNPTSGPTYSINWPTIDIAGTSNDDWHCVVAVNWSTDQGASGECDGLTSWRAQGIPLVLGANVITVTARDLAGNQATDTLTVNYSHDVTVAITYPTADPTYATVSPTLNLRGTASGSTRRVTWESGGLTGVCRGTKSWSSTSIPLENGINHITVTAEDARGNTATDMLTVMFTDTITPIVRITRPTSRPAYTTTRSKLNIGGIASDNTLVTDVHWNSSTGPFGQCSGTRSWKANEIPLALGENIITVTAIDRFGNMGEDTITVTFVDRTRPRVTITSPTNRSTYRTSSPTLDIGGDASDDVGVTSVAWSNDRGGSGVCTGTTTWSATGIPLLTGRNRITVMAYDSTGNVGKDTLIVTYRP